MKSFNSLLVATDFSVDGNNAVRRAALLAHEHGAGLHILHVLEDAGRKPLRDWFLPRIEVEPKEARARSALRRVAFEISGAYDVSPTVEVLIGEPFEALLQASERADLVVVGRRGHGRLNGLLVGRAGLGLGSTQTSFVLAHGSAVSSTLRHAQTLGADLIVAGKQGRSTLGSFLLGSVSNRVLSDAKCDTLIVPKPREDSPMCTATMAALRLKSTDNRVNAALAQDATAQAAALTRGHWIHNTARFSSGPSTS